MLRRLTLILRGIGFGPVSRGGNVTPQGAHEAPSFPHARSVFRSFRSLVCIARREEHLLEWFAYWLEYAARSAEREEEIRRNLMDAACIIKGGHETVLGHRA